MKPRFDPVLMSGLGLFGAPLVCAIDATLLAVVNGQISLWAAPIVFVQIALAAVVVCFPMGLASEKILRLWQDAQTTQARLLSAISGAVSLVVIQSFSPELGWKLPLTKEDYSVAAGVSVPVLWALLFLIFAFFARPPKPSRP